ncbi:hypothetical protein BDU57DRAFT_511232 [Ampelomyces quisqualis]|uniref:Uncharacterized protein n=1 Tax=Ampelomyces quisqualis TaxID=50730 RepID=A0A6A5R1Z9_AMPQU|nr:hypothetical protein BDU57DRAFT_511232 [Ampelomyces quisqualis]
MSPQSQSAQHITPPSQDPQAAVQRLDTEEQVDSSQLPGSPIQHFDDPTGLHLQVDFAWSKFRNTISEKMGDTLTPLYIQHFRPTKPQLRFDHAGSEDKFATGTINNFSISAECNINGTTIQLKPLKRWKTQYNYLSTTLSADPNTPAPISWIANMSMKLWDFVCLDENHIAIAKFSVNLWALKQVGNIYFDAPASKLAKEARDEIVVTGTSLLYVMMVRMNNPLHLLGSIFSKPGRVHGNEEDVEGTKDR